MTVLLREGQEIEVRGAGGSELWLHRDEVGPATGWQLKPEGFCRDEVCVPLPRGSESGYHRDDEVNVSAMWSLLGKPAVASGSGDVWFLGEGADGRNDQLLSLQAPDFTLPDFNGNLHALSNYRRMRVLLLTWASW